MENTDDTSPGDETSYTDSTLFQNLEFWMTDLPPQLKTLPINHLAIPVWKIDKLKERLEVGMCLCAGSHDTMTYTISRRGKIGPDGPSFLRHLGCFGFVAKPIVYNWSITQHEDVKAQLNGGIRYLDLRVARKGNVAEICFLHGLYGAAIEQPLQEISEWLSSHSGEVVVIDFQHFYEFDGYLHQVLIDIIENIFKDKLCPVFPSFSHISLQWLALEKYQVFAIYRSPVATNQRNLWFSSLWLTPWPNTVDPRYLVKFLDETLESRNKETGFVSQCLLTPDTFYIMKNVFGNLEKNLCNLCRDITLPWIADKKPGNGGLNVVISDFVSYNDFLFAKSVIQRNVELLKHTNETVSGRYIEVRSRS